MVEAAERMDKARLEAAGEAGPHMRRRRGRERQQQPRFYDSFDTPNSAAGSGFGGSFGTPSSVLLPPAACSAPPFREGSRQQAGRVSHGLARAHIAQSKVLRCRGRERGRSWETIADAGIIYSCRFENEREDVL